MTGTVFFNSSVYNLDDNFSSGDGSGSPDVIELLLSRPFEETTTIYISVMDEGSWKFIMYIYVCVYIYRP